MYWFASLDHVLRHGDSTWHLGQTKGNSLDRVGAMLVARREVVRAGVRVRIGSVYCQVRYLSKKRSDDFWIFSRDLEFFVLLGKTIN